MSKQEQPPRQRGETRTQWAERVVKEAAKVQRIERAAAERREQSRQAALRAKGETIRAAISQILGAAVVSISIYGDCKTATVDLNQDSLTSVTFANLERLSKALDTRVINIQGNAETGPLSEVTGGDCSSLYLEIAEIGWPE